MKFFFFIILFYNLTTFAVEVRDSQVVKQDSTTVQDRSDSRLDFFYDSRMNTKDKYSEFSDYYKKIEVVVGYADQNIAMTDMNSVMSRNNTLYSARNTNIDAIDLFGVSLGYNFWNRHLSVLFDYSFGKTESSNSVILGAFNYTSEVTIYLLKSRIDIYSYRNLFLSFDFGPGFLQSKSKIENHLGSYEFSGSAYGYQAGLSTGFYFFNLYSLRVSYLYTQFIVQKNDIDKSRGIVFGLLQSSSGRELKKTDSSNFSNSYTGSGLKVELSVLF